MSTRYQDLEARLLAAGFRVHRQKGSHRCYRHPDGRTVGMKCNHPGKDANYQALRDVRKVLQGESDVESK